MMIAVHCASTADVARLFGVCHAFHTPWEGEPASLVEDALRIRLGIGRGRPRSVASLLREERLRELAQRLCTEHDGVQLQLSAETNSGYAGVTHEPWNKPFGHRAEVGGAPWHRSTRRRFSYSPGRAPPRNRRAARLLLLRGRRGRRGRPVCQNGGAEGTY